MKASYYKLVLPCNLTNVTCKNDLKQLLKNQFYNETFKTLKFKYCK